MDRSTPMNRLETVTAAAHGAPDGAEGRSDPVHPQRDATRRHTEAGHAAALADLRRHGADAGSDLSRKPAHGAGARADRARRRPEQVADGGAHAGDEPRLRGRLPHAGVAPGESRAHGIEASLAGARTDHGIADAGGRFAGGLAEILEGFVQGFDVALALDLGSEDGLRDDLCHDGRPSGLHAERIGAPAAIFRQAQLGQVACRFSDGDGVPGGRGPAVLGRDSHQSFFHLRRDTASFPMNFS